jgi:oxygen-independent coproporphyrinogen-3 oxidase
MLRCGVGRISVNPQTMNDDTLRAVGRDHTAAQTEEIFRLARALGFADINMDVIAGLPGETTADFAYTMARIADLNPDSLTVHTLAIKRSSRLHLEGAPLADADAVAEMTALGGATADALGMEPYYLYRQKYMAGQQQNVGYARPGAACLYNVDIMEETASILACGAGAISKRVFTDHDLRIERAPNVTNVAEYIARAPEMAARKAALYR